MKMNLHKWFNWKIKPKIISLTFEAKNKSKLIGSLSLVKSMMNTQLNSIDVQNVDTLDVISHNTFIQKNGDNLTLNLIKHKKVCIGKSFEACPMQTGSKNLGRFLVI